LTGKVALKTKKEKQAMANQAAAQAKQKPQATHETPTDLSREGVAEITAALRQLLADTFALYLKTKNFHWHMTGPHFRDRAICVNSITTASCGGWRISFSSSPLTGVLSKGTSVPRRLAHLA
jgi:hypothetical protein